MAKNTRNTVILAKTEVNYGVDPTPTAADNAILMGNLALQPLVADAQDREYFSGSFGHNPQLFTNKRVTISFNVEAAAAGVADTPPGWAPLLKACAFAQTVTAATDVAFNPISDNIDSVTIYCYVDGFVQKILGCRGTFTLTLSPGAVPVFQFTFTGIYSGPADEANPNPVLTAFKKPLSVDKANATLQLHGESIITSELTFDIANNVVPEDLINSNEVLITDRAPTGQATFNLTTVAAKDWISLAEAQTEGVLDFDLGDAAGQNFDVDCPKVVLGQPTIGDRDSTRTIQIPFRMIVNAGDDEMIIKTS